jgi:vitamin B12 transporter
MPLRQVGTSVSVITDADIEARGFSSLFEILRAQPAIAASNPGGAGKTTSLRIRGEEGYRTRAYIDGIDVSDTSGTQSSPRFEEMLSSGIERVEILRGPQGLMYGADAGGVINISTRQGRSGLQGVLNAETGRYGSDLLSADIGGGSEGLDYALQLSRFGTGGFNASTNDTENRDEDGYDNTTAHGRLGWQADDDLRLELVARSTESDNEYDDCFTPVSFTATDHCRNDYRQRAWRVAGEYHPGAVGHRLAYSGSDTERQNYAGGEPAFGARGRLDKWTYLGDYSRGDQLRLVYGAERLSEAIDDGNIDRERDQDGYFFEYQGSFGPALYLTAGARRDHNDDFGAHSTYRVSGAYVVAVAAGELKFKVAYGTGFRAPSLYEVAYNRGAFAFPPASETSLAIEESAGYDLGVVWSSASDAYLEANYFDQRISDAIYFDLVNYSGYLQDSGESRSRGVELIGALALGDHLQLSGNYTWNETEAPDGSARPQRPRHLANLGLHWQAALSGLRVGVYLRAVGDAVDIDGRPLDDYAVVDLNSSYPLWRTLEVYGRLENLLDADYQEVPGYHTAGAALYAGLRYSF